MFYQTEMKTVIGVSTDCYDDENEHNDKNYKVKHECKVNEKRGGISSYTGGSNTKCTFW